MTIEVAQIVSVIQLLRTRALPPPDWLDPPDARLNAIPKLRVRVPFPSPEDTCYLCVNRVARRSVAAGTKASPPLPSSPGGGDNMGGGPAEHPYGRRAGQEVIDTKPRIFVGSSSEAVELARKIGAAIDKAGMTAVVWDTSAFPVGSTLLERIESLAEEVEGAILLFTPDVHAVRAGKATEEAVSNVIFEYGYLSAD